jgi:hypothetical protein
MSDMKLIMEGWRGYLHEQEDPFQTIGDLRQVLKRIIASKKQGAAIDAAKDIAAGAILDVIPGAATVKSLFDLVKPMYSLPDEKRTGTSLDKLDVDDDISDIVDDTVEDNFLIDFAKILERYPDTTPLNNVNITKALQNYISNKYNKRTVVMPSEG